LITCLRKAEKKEGRKAANQTPITETQVETTRTVFAEEFPKVVDVRFED
jgi:hypothetical protein